MRRSTIEEKSGKWPLAQLTVEETTSGREAYNSVSSHTGFRIFEGPVSVPFGGLMANGEDVIMVISSNNAFAHSLKQMLSANGYSITLASGEGVGLVQAQRPASLVLVDRLSANFKSIRQHPALMNIPLLAVQQPGSVCQEEDCIDDLDAGADAWLCDQSYRQLLARIRAISRRSQYVMTSSNRFEVGGIRVDLEKHEVSVYNRLVELTLKEFKILTEFARAPNRVFSRQELLNLVWGEDYALEEHALDVYIHSLRKKIEPDPSKPTFIITVRKVGFKFIPA